MKIPTLVNFAPFLAVAMLGLGPGCGRTDLELSGKDGGRVVNAPDAGWNGVGGRGGGGGFSRGGAPGTGGVFITGGQSGIAGIAGRAGSGGVDGGIRDGAVDGRGADGGGPDLPPTTPGGVTCGPQTCVTNSQSCCIGLSTGAAGARCIAAGTTCSGAALRCDEPADCSAGICCAGLQSSGGIGLGFGSQCVARAACTGVGRFVVCRTDADCGSVTPVCCASFGVPVCQASCPGR